MVFTRQLLLLAFAEHKRNGGKPTLLCALLALAAMAQLTAVCSVPTAEPVASEEYVIEVDAEAANDDGGVYVVETGSDIVIEYSQEDTRARHKANCAHA